MRSLTFCFISLLSAASWALDVDFSQSYISTSDTGTNKVRIDNLKVTADNTTTAYSALFTVDGANLLLNSAALMGTNPRGKEYALNRSVWEGDYKTTTNVYRTTLTLKSVFNGFAAGEMIHATSEAEPTTYLRVQVAGDIGTQYKINQDGTEQWLDPAAYETLIAKIDAANAKLKEGVEKTSYPTILSTRHLLKMKRIKALESRHPDNKWSTSTEYSITIEGDNLTGNAGTPPDTYSSSDATTNNGSMELSFKRFE